MKTITDVLNDCKTKGRVIVLPDYGYDRNLFIILRMIMFNYGGEYYPSEKNRGFVFRDLDAKSNQTEELLKKIIKENSNKVSNYGL